MKLKISEQIQKLEQLQQNCQTKVEGIDENHFMTRNFISTMADIIREHLEEGNCQLKEEQKENITTTPQSKGITEEQYINGNDVIENKIYIIRKEIERIGINIEYSQIFEQIKKTIQELNQLINEKITKENDFKNLHDEIHNYKHNINSLESQLKKLNYKNMTLQFTIKELEEENDRRKLIYYKKLQPIKIEDWVDKECFYYNKIKYENDNIICNHNGRIDLFGSIELSGYCIFSIEVVKMHDFIEIGIIDQSLRKEEKLYNKYEGRCFYFESDKKCFNGDKLEYDIGCHISFRSIVTVYVNFESGEIEWKVDGYKAYLVKSEYLTNKDIKWVPYCSMNKNGASIRIVQ